jgi:hypothetical protein
LISELEHTLGVRSLLPTGTSALVASFNHFERIE